MQQLYLNIAAKKEIMGCFFILQIKYTQEIETAQTKYRWKCQQALHILFNPKHLLRI